jgi:membrane protein
VTTVVEFARRSLRRFFELEGFDRSMALAGQAFAAFLPLVIVVGAYSPASAKDAATTLIERFDLTGEAAASVRDAVAQPADVESSASVIGVVILVLSALAFTRALQRLYTRAWGLGKLGVRGNVYGLIWLAAFVTYFSIQPLVVGIFNGETATAVSLTTSTALWLFTPWLLVGRQISWHRLLPQAILTALGLAALGLAAAIYMPTAITSAAKQFGFIGIGFSLLSFFFAASFVLVATAALGATLAPQSPGAGEESARGRA